MAITINVNLNSVVRVRGLRSLGRELLIMVKNLTEAVDRLSAAVDRVTSLPTGGDTVPQVDVDVEAARINEQAARLEKIGQPADGGDATAEATRRK
jgi:hypothetical protein